MYETNKNDIEILPLLSQTNIGGLEPWAVEAFQILNVDSAYPQLHRLNEDFAKLYHEREQAIQHLANVKQECFWRMALAIATSECKASSQLLQVGVYAALLADQMGCSIDYCNELQQAALLINIGMLGISNTAPPINHTRYEQEKALLRAHPQIGADILGAGAIPEYKLAAEAALSHHEMFDGKGYPSQLESSAIPLSGRIIAVAECFQSLTSNTAYRTSLPVPVALNLIRMDSGSHFDPKVVYALEEMLNLFNFVTLEFARMDIPKVATAPDANYWQTIKQNFIAQRIEPHAHN
jgi:putative two-component system response regulator